MDQRDLQVFRVLCRNLHFGRTSEECSLSPSALSRMVQRLEEETGQPLFLRDRRGVEMTRAGEALLDYAEETLSRWEALQGTLQREERVLRGQISLYASVTACYTVLPGVLSAFRRRHPGVRIDLVTGDAAGGWERVREGQVDVTVIAEPEGLTPSAAFLQLTETPLRFIAPREEGRISRLAGLNGPVSEGRSMGGGAEGWEKRAHWGELPVVLSRSGLARKRLEAWFRRQGIRPRVYAQAAGNEAISALVALGCGVGVVPALVLDKSPFRDQLRVLPVAQELEPYYVGLAALKRRLRDPALAAFWECAATE